MQYVFVVITMLFMPVLFLAIVLLFILVRQLRQRGEILHISSFVKSGTKIKIFDFGPDNVIFFRKISEGENGRLYVALLPENDSVRTDNEYRVMIDSNKFATGRLVTLIPLIESSVLGPSV